MAAVTYIAFSTTYLVPVAVGRFSGPAILHLHGALFLAWPLYLLVQAFSITRSRRWHRTLGLIGISLATAMVWTGLDAIGSSINSWSARGVAIEGQAISIVAFSGVLLFAVLFTVAIAKTRDWASHARLMALATLAIMQATSGRLVLTMLLRGNPEMLRPGLLPPIVPELAMVPHLVFDLLCLGAMLGHDFRTTGRVHRATLYGGAAILGVHVTRHLFAATVAWTLIANWLAAL